MTSWALSHRSPRFRSLGPLRLRRALNFQRPSQSQQPGVVYAFPHSVLHIIYRLAALAPTVIAAGEKVWLSPRGTPRHVSAI